MLLTSVFQLKLIYVFRIDDAQHEGCLKVGETTCRDDISLSLKPNSPLLQAAAKSRIDSFTRTAAVPYELLHTELALVNQNGYLLSFSDKDVHRVLQDSGIKRKEFTNVQGAKEWFVTDLETVKQAIATIKAGNTVIEGQPVEINDVETAKQSSVSVSTSGSQAAHFTSKATEPIVFRPEQNEAIKKTVARFRKNAGGKMLWNAKMRFGKTLTALQVVKTLGYSRTLILTHRPVVNDSWFEDFRKIFTAPTTYDYGSKMQGRSIAELEQAYQADSKCKYIFFASMQDLRGSSLVGGNFDKNQEIFDTPWDLIIVDEAHEGTQTDLGKEVINQLQKPRTRMLYLSGTPFNLQQDFDAEECFVWDYVMEQRAKQQWSELHGSDHNPYAVLPRMKIFTYDLGKLAQDYLSQQAGEVSFNFAEFFRIDPESQKLVHEQHVKQFLQLLTTAKGGKNEESYPFATAEYREMFRHTLWVVPGVKAAAALSELLKNDPVFKDYKIINVAGDALIHEDADNALDAVKVAIGARPEQTRTITISCGRLTTGVSVPAWTGVLILSGSEATSASSYMQTIFRVQTPAEINGRIKDTCYVFDFAPDRALRVLADVVQVSVQAGKTTQQDRQTMDEFLKFCPIIAVKGSQMHRLSVSRMMEQLKKVYADRVLHHGFEDRLLYSNDLLHLENEDLELLQHLDAVLQSGKGSTSKKDVVSINEQGLSQEKQPGESRQPKKRELTEEEKELKLRKQQQEKAIRTLSAISIRMPLLIYGAELNDESQEITIDNFVDLIDDASWVEFMPAHVTKEDFQQLKHCYDADIFCAAGKRIRALARAADDLPIERRISCLTALFGTFRNPDKETVLTPWRVVNDHLGRCLGGYMFKVDESVDIRSLYAQPEQDDAEFAAYTNAVLQTQDFITFDAFAGDSRILELNSKSGLYPLYATYSIYRFKLRTRDYQQLSKEEQQKAWDEVLAKNIFVICKTPMARSITCRTLAGFRKTRVNAKCYPDLIEALKDPSSDFFRDVVDGKNFWQVSKERNMRFNAIVGNPPYQVQDGGNKASAIPIYNYFVEGAIKLQPNYVSMIMPAKWFSDGKGLESFRQNMFNDKHVKKIVDYLDSRDCFSNVDIAGGVCYILWDRNYHGACEFCQINQGQESKTMRDLSDNFFRFEEGKLIWQKIKSVTATGSFYSEKVSSRNPFGLASNVRPSAEGDLVLVYTKSQTGAFSSAEVKKGLDMIPMWKLMTTRSTSEHSGQADKKGQKRVLATLSIIEPQHVCTDTYIILDSFATQEEAQAALKYFKTRLVRFLISQIAQVQNISKEKFALVPVQNFTANSDIDWSQSVDDIDQQLNRKYLLSEDDIAYINATIKPYD